MGNRIAKQVSGGRNGTTTSHYTRDAQGNTMAVYHLSLNPRFVPEYNLKEHHIYGSSRLGLQEYDVSNVPTDFHRLVGDKRYELSNHLGNVLSVISDRKIVQKNMKLLHHDTFNEDLYWESLNEFGNSSINVQRELLVAIQPLNLSGTTMNLEFEENKTVMFNFDVKRLSNFPISIPINLEIRDTNDRNVIWSSIISSDGVASGSFTPTTTADYLVTLSANNTTENEIEFTLDNFYAYEAPASTSDFVSLFLPDVLAYNDYYPFGMLVPNRYGSSDSYRYGFQGQEKDDEIKGEGNSYDFGARMLDPRVGRWFAKDPLQMKYPSMSPYVSFENNPIIFIDPDGKDAVITISGNTITVKTVIYVDNSGKNKMNVAQAQSDIMNTWGKDFKDSSGKYNVKFDIIVLEKPTVLYDIVGNTAGNLPSINEFGIDSRSTNIVIPQSDDFRSHVTGAGGKYGKWSVNKRGTEYAHEVGHFFGLADLYSDTFFENVSDKNDLKNGTPRNPVFYDKNKKELMAIGGDNKLGEKAKVTQRSIDAIVEFALQGQINGEAIINLKTVKKGGLAAPTKEEKIEVILSLPPNTTINKPRK